jgi:hypothetical protein
LRPKQNLADAAQQQHHLRGAQVSGLKDRAAVDVVEPLTPAAAVDRHLRTARAAERPRLRPAGVAVRALQPLRVEVLEQPLLNLTFDLGQHFTYDATGQQIFVDWPNLWQFYDGDRLRVKKTEGGANTPTYYLRSSVLGGQVVAEINASGSLQRSYVGSDVMKQAPPAQV